MAVGLGVVAPTLVATIFDERWRPLGPMLVLLSALSVARPVGWAVASYLQARQLPRYIFGLEAFKLVCLMGFIVSIGRTGPLWTCAAVGVAFGAHGLASLWVIREVDAIPLRRSLGSLAPALSASLVMVAVVLVVRVILTRLGPAPAPLALLVEVTTGALAYLLAAVVLARRVSQELVSKLRDALRPPAVG